MESFKLNRNIAQLAILQRIELSGPVLKKFRKLCTIQNNKYWLNYIDANLYTNNKSNDKALELLNDIVKNSKDKKLIYFAKQKITNIKL